MQAVTSAGGKRERLTTQWAMIITGLITALATLAVGFFAGRNTSILGQLPRETTTVTRAEPGPTIFRTVTAGTTAGPSGSAATTAGSVYHPSELLGLSAGHQADLDAPPSDHQWGMTGLTPGAQTDIVWDAPEGLSAYDSATMTSDVHAPLGYTACATAQDFVGPGAYFEPHRLTAGTSLCVLTSDKRFALLTVRSIAADESSIQLTVTTYNR